MKKVSLCIWLLIVLCGCSTPPSATNDGVRTLVLDGINVSEKETDNGFTAWELEDYYEGGHTVIEVGYYEINGKQYGFVLFDGGYTGTFAIFSREGIDYRWDWGNSFRYCITVSPNEIARYYDFSFGERQKPRGIYRAEKR